MAEKTEAHEQLEELAETDGEQVALALHEVAFALREGLGAVAFQIKMLGGGDNTDHRGAVEFLAIELREGLDQLASSTHSGLEAVADKTREGLENVAALTRVGMEAIADGIDTPIPPRRPS